jgi:hypothetical protein
VEVLSVQYSLLESEFGAVVVVVVAPDRHFLVPLMEKNVRIIYFSTLHFYFFMGVNQWLSCVG